MTASDTSQNKKLVYEVYEFEEIIGNGAYSSVVSASHNETKKPVAIKIIDRSKLKSVDEERVRREIEINRLLDHPHIVKVFEVYTTDEDVSFVMELMRGGELFERIAKYGPMSEEIARQHMKNLLDCIQYIHSKGIAHRDLKPENLLFESNDPDSKIKICDFGFAKRDIGNALETPIGTLAYVAPEVLKDDHYSKSVDLWSLGCILYFMLVGRPPFYSEDEQEIEKLTSIGKYTFPETPVISDDAKDLIRHLLEMDPDKRYTATQALQHRWFKEQEESDNVNEKMEKIHISPPQSQQEISQLRGAINKAIDSQREKEENKQPTFNLIQAIESPIWKTRQQKKQKQTRNNNLTNTISTAIQHQNEQKSQPSNNNKVDQQQR